MAGVTIIFDDDSTIKLDATMSQDHQFGAEITDYPLEDGARAADHISVRPYKLTIRGIISYVPIVKPESPENRQPTRHTTGFDRLRRAITDREIVKVQTGLHVYTDMAFEDMGVRKDEPTYDVPLALTFKQIRFATAKTAAIPKDAIGKPPATATTPAAARQSVRNTRDQAGPKRTQGPVQRKPATPAQASKAQSLLNTLLSGKLKF
ncbi:hypothetical protein D3C72_1078040 [compost metagenome]